MKACWGGLLGSKNFNAKRKLFHLSGLGIPLFLEIAPFDFLESYIPEPNRMLLIVFLLFYIVFLFLLDFLRFRHRKVNRFFLKSFVSIMKPEERSSHNASLSYFLGFFLILLILPLPLFTLCCIFLIIADPCAAYIGSRFGRLRFANSRSLEGFLAFLCSAFLSGVIYLSLRSFFYSEESIFSLFDYTDDGLMIHIPVLMFLCSGALCAALAEFFSSKGMAGLIDDNLTVPLAGALGLFLGGYFLASYPIEALLDPFWQYL